MSVRGAILEVLLLMFIYLTQTVHIFERFIMGCLSAYTWLFCGGLKKGGDVSLQQKKKKSLAFRSGTACNQYGSKLQNC